MSEAGKVKLQDVRLAFPSLFEAEGFQGSAENAKFKATFLFAPTHPAAAAIRQAMEAVAKAKWGDKAAAVAKSLMSDGKVCLRDGDGKSEYAGFAGNLYVAASNEVRPLVIDGARNPLSVQDGKPYAGCFVNAVIQVWAQDNKFGKRINASLQGVQFLRDGERLSGGGAASEDEFEAIPEAASATGGAAPADGAGSLFG